MSQMVELQSLTCPSISHMINGHCQTHSCSLGVDVVAPQLCVRECSISVQMLLTFIAIVNRFLALLSARAAYRRDGRASPDLAVQTSRT